MAYADDVTLFDGSTAEMGDLLTETSEYLSSPGLKEEARLAWQAQDSQGVGVLDLLLNQAALKPGQFIDALKFRTNTYGTRVAIHRGTRTDVSDCRRCHSKPDTSSGSASPERGPA
ncbi:hypothetical protein J6590_052717 [Homalodisca vitripennis]|nr:hypothetical protein J6590_052717 [Homalodisca vitripennis]